jgi:hypothetical protein
VEDSKDRIARRIDDASADRSDMAWKNLPRPGSPGLSTLRSNVARSSKGFERE